MLFSNSTLLYLPNYLTSKVLVTQLCLTLCNSMDCSLTGSSVHGILQARTLEWVAIPFSRRSSWGRVRTQVSCIAGRFFTVDTSTPVFIATLITIAKTRKRPKCPLTGMDKEGVVHMYNGILLSH